MKISLECQSVDVKGQKFLSCKTSIENSSKKPIKMEYSMLLIIKIPKTIGFAINIVLDEARKINIESDTRNLLDPVIVKFLKDSYSNKELVSPNSDLILKSLTNYYLMNEKLGSLERLATGYNYPVDPGLYGIYFYVLGENWVKDKSHSRGAHDEVLV